MNARQRRTARRECVRLARKVAPAWRNVVAIYERFQLRVPDRTLATCPGLRIVGDRYGVYVLAAHKDGRMTVLHRS